MKYEGLSLTFSPMRILLLLASLLLSACATVPEALQLGTTEKTAQATKRIALSFDDAPRGNGPMFSGRERTDVLIDTLRTSSAAPAVFFVKTSNFKLPEGRERIARYAEAGHLIANHTHSHDWLSKTETAEYIADIDQAEKLLKGFTNRRPWFRFPYLDEGRPREKRDALRDALNKRELRNGYVTVDNFDWYLEQKWQLAVKESRSVNLTALKDVYVDMLVGAIEFYDALAISALGRSPTHMLLLHENDVAALFVDDLVLELHLRGWQIVSPDVVYSDPVAAVIPKTLKTRQGHIGALAIEAGTDPRTLTHLAIEEDLIDALLAERQVFGPRAESELITDN